MKRFVFRLVIFGLIVAAGDRACGMIGKALGDNVKGGGSYKENYICHKTSEDILVFGSSRASHHYEPDVLEQELGMSVYNCGFDGNGIILAYSFYQIISDRYDPKIIICEITPGFDLLKSDNHTFLGRLRRFYGHEGIDSVFANVDWIENHKMMSQAYRYNSVILKLAINNIHPVNNYRKGFSPLRRTMDYEPPADDSENTTGQNAFEYDSLKLHYLEKLIQECEGKTQLVFAVSPSYKNTDDSVLQPIKTLCEQYDIPLLNHYTDSTFNYTREIFQDKSHLNHRGATAYTKVIAKEMKAIIDREVTTTSNPQGRSQSISTNN